MSYTKLYIEQTWEEGRANDTGTASKLYLLPGLIDQHTSALPEAELMECRQKYNEYLGFYRKKLDKSLTDGDRANMEYWIEEMHGLLRKIGRYTHEEMMGGFTI